jgi:nitric oxide reductase subunit B
MKGKGLMMTTIASFVIAMGILLIGGYFALDKVPPYPKTISAQGEVVATRGDIMAGQDVFQKYGLMNHGSVWGHGSLRGMDFSATTLHQVGAWMRDYYAQEKGGSYADLPKEVRDGIDGRVITEIKENLYDPQTQILSVPAGWKYALEKNREYWDRTFGEGDKSYGFLPNTIKSASERKAVADFFLWTAWAAGTIRHGDHNTYTNNWPSDSSVGNSLSSDAFIWSVASILSLFLGLGLIIYVVHRFRFFYGETKSSAVAQKLTEMDLTSSQIKAAKFFLVVILLFIAQLCLGGLMAHYTVHPADFYIPWIAGVIPYSLAKTWHLQLAIFWIATTWIGTSIFLAPIIAGKEPRGQGILVNILFGAVLIVAVGSLTGEALGINNMLGDLWFWFGHQGWEYLELGRFWQILLFVGLVAWLFIVYRALKNKLFGPQRDTSGLVMFYVVSAIFIVGFFAFGFFYGQGSHLSIADYWRWFVVHLWVEGMFEFFGVAAISLFLVTLGLVDKKSAMRVAYLTAILVFASGIVGTAHHYYWWGGPSYWLALGGVFSSLEPLPLLLLVVRAWQEYRAVQNEGIDFPYRWPLFFLVASSFWNFLGAGVFGFLINLPAVNYFSHATYLTVNHGHGALFGVYGMLSISLMLFTWRSLIKNQAWNNKLLAVSFWCMNGGLLLMTFGTLLPVGILQTLRASTSGFWMARSADFYSDPTVLIFGNWRLVPDTIIIIGALSLLVFLFKTYPSLKKVGFKEDEPLFESKKKGEEGPF